MKQRSRAEWEQLLAEFESSGQTLTKFAAEHGVNASYLGTKRKQLNRSTPFVPVQVARPAASARVSVQVGDVAIRCDGEVSVRWLSSLVRELRA